MSRNARVVPYSQAAEESLIGAALLSATALEILVHEVVPEDFYVVRHQVIVAHLIRMWHAGIIIDIVTLGDELQRVGDLEIIGGASTLVTLQANCAGTSTAPNYVRTIIDYAARRRMLHAASEIIDKAYDGSVGLDALTDLARHTFGTLDMPVLAGSPDPNVEQFLEGTEEYDWLIEGLMEHRDRLILTGGEGGGKTTMCRQISVCASAGIHPFNHTPIIPVRVLIVDCENSEIQTRRKMRPLMAQANRLCQQSGYEPMDPDRLRINIKTDGLDLMQRTDVRWLMERCEANKPDLLVIGPLYKLHAGDPTDEGPARHVSRALDTIRHRYGCALLMEAHSPYGQAEGKRIGRPYGASLWSRWPEFGYCLFTDKDVPDNATFEPWRGPRDERLWPKELVRASQGASQPWPWMQTEDPGGFNSPPPDRERFAAPNPQSPPNLSIVKSEYVPKKPYVPDPVSPDDPF